MKKSKDWFDRALEFLDESNYSQALVAITRYVAENPENKNGKLLNSVILNQLSHYKAALDLLSTIKPTEEDNEKYFLLYYDEMGVTYTEMGNYAEAIKWYDKIISLIPTKPWDTF